MYEYWRTVIPNDTELKKIVLRELHCVPYSRAPGIRTNPGGRQDQLLLEAYDPGRASICR